MRRTWEEMKRELMAEAEAMIDELAEWSGGGRKPTLAEIEEMVLKLRKEIGQRMAAAVLASQEESAPVPGPLCPGCGREMRYKGKKKDSVESLVGSLELERGYYHCPECGEGAFPPGSATGAEGQALE